VSLPGLNGLELQQFADQPDMPSIVITGYGDVPMSVRAMKAGAVEFLTKPFRDDRELGISEITVKAHRGQVMRKMNAESLPDLVTMAARLGLRSAPKE